MPELMAQLLDLSQSELHHAAEVNTSGLAQVMREAYNVHENPVFYPKKNNTALKRPSNDDCPLVASLTQTRPNVTRNRSTTTWKGSWRNMKTKTIYLPQKRINCLTYTRKTGSGRTTNRPAHGYCANISVDCLKDRSGYPSSFEHTGPKRRCDKRKCRRWKWTS